MQNPYARLIALMRTQARAPEPSFFAVSMHYDSEKKVARYTIDARTVDLPFLLAPGLSAGEADSGSTYLCMATPLGFVLLCKL